MFCKTQTYVFRWVFGCTLYKMILLHTLLPVEFVKFLLLYLVNQNLANFRAHLELRVKRVKAQIFFCRPDND